MHLKTESLQQRGLDMSQMGTLFEITGTPFEQSAGSANTPENRMVCEWNGIFLTFITEDGTQYVTRASPRKISELEESGYTKKMMIIPFADGVYPENNSDEYNVFRAMMDEVDE